MNEHEPGSDNAPCFDGVWPSLIGALPNQNPGSRAPFAVDFFDERFTWMQPQLLQRAYETWRRYVRRDAMSGERILIGGLPHRIRRTTSAAVVETWDQWTLTHV